MEREQQLHPHVLCIGAGNMAAALLVPAVRNGAINAQHLVLAEPDTSKHAVFTHLGASCTTSVMEALVHVPDDTILMLAVKPQHLSDVCAAFDLAAGRKFLAHPRTCISILAGSTRDGISHQFRRAVYSADIRVIRVMPNTPAGVGKGIAAICAGATVDEAHLTFARTLLSATSTLIDLDESMFDAFTAIAGSGPAYLFYLVEAMQRGAEAVGFDSATARTLAERTVVGSAHLLESSDSSAQELRTAVTSKGGTTQAATTEMDNHDVMQTVADAIVKARDRGRELGQASGKE